MDASIPVFEKPHQRPSVLDWTRNIQRLQNEARLRRFDSYQLRQRATQLRNESSVTTRWDNYVNTELLRDRIFQVESWRERQRYTREQVRDEMRALKEDKHATELHLESLQIPLMVSNQCLSTRDMRVPPELTRDQLGEELKQELHLIESHKRTLTELCHSAWQKMKELSGVGARLQRELAAKDEALAVDYYVHDLDRDSGEISYKVDPTRIPVDSMSEKNYVECMENTIKIAEQLMSESRALRESMFRAREASANQRRARAHAAGLALRRRLYDTQRARNEMDWQKYKLEQHLQMLDREIESLRVAVADKINPTKLVETRLDTRTRRPVLERVQDEPMRGLLEEYERVHLSSSKLENKLEEALRTYHGMYTHLQRINKDLEYKNQALETDRRLIEIRKPLHDPNETQFKRNVGYCHMAEELIPE